MFGISMTKIVDPYNTMGRARDQRAASERRTEDRKAARREMERVARKRSLTLEAAAELIQAAAVVNDETAGWKRRDNAENLYYAILDDPAKHQNWR